MTEWIQLPVPTPYQEWTVLVREGNGGLWLWSVEHRSGFWLDGFAQSRAEAERLAGLAVGTPLSARAPIDAPLAVK